MKNICRALLLVLTFVLVLSFASCKEEKTPYTDDLAKAKLTEIVNILQRGEHVHTEDYVYGMTEDEFEPVGKAISDVVGKDNSYEIIHVETTEATDDDSNLVHYAKFTIKLNNKSVNVTVLFVDGDNTIYSVKL